MSEAICDHCGASMKSYWHRMTPMLADALIKAAKGVKAKGENKIHPVKDLKGTPYELSADQRANWTKLRFHGLVAKYGQDIDREGGYWVITRKAGRFLQGEAIPARVRTFRNQVEEHSEELVAISQIAGEWLERTHDYEVMS